MVEANSNQQTIEQALLTLMASKPFDEISMSDLIVQANIGRATFYRYFKTKTDILNSVSNRTKAEIEGAVIETIERLGPDLDFVVYVAETLDVYYDHRDTLKILWGSNSTGNYVIRLVEETKLLFASLYSRVQSSNSRQIPNDYAVNLYLSTLFAMLIFWMTKPLPEKPAQFKVILLNAFNTAPMQLIEKA